MARPASSEEWLARYDAIIAEFKEKMAGVSLDAWTENNRRTIYNGAKSRLMIECGMTAGGATAVLSRVRIRK